MVEEQDELCSQARYGGPSLPSLPYALFVLQAIPECDSKILLICLEGDVVFVCACRFSFNFF